MRPMSLIFAVTTAASLGGCARQPDIAAEERTIRELEKQWVQAVAAKDTTARQRLRRGWGVPGAWRSSRERARRCAVGVGCAAESAEPFAHLCVVQGRRIERR